MTVAPAQLIKKAEEARERAHAPYSGFTVGAALLTVSGAVFTGCNVENASFGATICAERVAVGSMVAAGEKEIAAIAVVAGKEGERASGVVPCGICLQVLAEFAKPLTPVITLDEKGGLNLTTLSELLPKAFKL